MSARASNQLAPGVNLDRYELLCPLAEGGMAQVWVARLRGKQGLDTLFAVKVLSSRLAAEPAAQAMLLDEARIASHIRHPHVAQIVELGDDDGIFYLVLEWVDGESLSMLRRAAASAGRPFPARLALSILAAASSGLHAAHEVKDDDGSPLQVVHRDVSPQNILVGAAGEVKVIDFGIAKAARRLTETTRQGDIKGKVQYMAPEQVTAASVDRRADIWGVGAVLYHLISGSTPFAGQDELSVLRLLLAKERPPQLTDVEPEITRILNRTLVPDPNERIDTAEELSHELEKAALALGGVAPAREIGRFVDELIGARLTQRRTAIKNALSSVATKDVKTAPTRRREAGSATLKTSDETGSTTVRTPSAEVVDVASTTERMPGEEPSVATSAQTLPAITERRAPAAMRNLRRAGITAAALVTLGIGGAWLLGRSKVEPEVTAVEPVTTVEPTPAAATVITAAPAEPSVSSPPSPAEPKTPRSAVTTRRAKPKPAPAPARSVEPPRPPSFTDQIKER